MRWIQATWLSSTSRGMWDKCFRLPGGKKTKTLYRRTFFRDLSRIFLSLARVPLPSIGSFVIDKDGYLQLTNRPLLLEIQDREISEDAVDYEAARTELMEILENEEGLFGEASRKANLSGIMDRSWRSGTFWFSLALASPVSFRSSTSKFSPALVNIVRIRMRPSKRQCHGTGLRIL